MSRMECNSVRVAYIHKTEHLDERKLICCGGPIFLMRTERRVSVRLSLLITN